MSLELTSSAFRSLGAIPAKYTCDGDDLSPPLAWTGVPQGARGLALVVDDPDAPDPRAPKRVFVHWVLYDLPPSTGQLPEGVSSGDLPAGAREGENDWHRAGFGGPCPPIGRHRYLFKLYALDAMLGDLGSPTRKELEHAMEGHVIEQTQLVGTYQRTQ